MTGGSDTADESGESARAAPSEREPESVDVERAPISTAEEARLAEDALGDNRLEEALVHAEAAITRWPEDKDLEARMRLVQAIAAVWLARYEDAQRWARSARELFAEGSTGWYAALSHGAIAHGRMAQTSPLIRFADLLAGLEKGCDSVSNAHLVACCRVAIQLAENGLLDRARATLLDAQARTPKETRTETLVRAWLVAARAELSRREGDGSLYLDLATRAAEQFRAAGDSRNEAAVMTSIGLVSLRLGLHDRAEGALREAIRLVESIGLPALPDLRCALGAALARSGKIAEARAVLEPEVDVARACGDGRLEAALHVHLAEAAASERDWVRALEAAGAAIQTSSGLGSLQAHALALRGCAHLKLGAIVPAERDVSAARDLLEALGRVEEGEASIRGAELDLAIHTGDATAPARARESDRWLSKVAQQISNEKMRESFLSGVPENRRLRALVKSVLDSD